MIRSRFFLRYALLGTVVSIVLMLLSIAVVGWLRDSFNDRSLTRRGAPFRIVDSLINEIPPEKRASTLMKIQERGPENRRPPFFLVDASGKVLFPTGAESARGFENFAFGTTRINEAGEEELGDEKFRVIKLSGLPQQYFVVLRRPPPPPDHGMFVWMTLIQMSVIVLAVLITMGILIYSLRSRARQAEHIIRELSRGNLKSRFPITIMDEVGQVMFSFNKMADEIEHLIESLRKSEGTRKDLLRQLAHDLRTPIASLRNMIETVRDQSDALSEQKRIELLDLSVREIDYFNGLVNDLLFLGSVQEPLYKSDVYRFDLIDLIKSEIAPIGNRYPKITVDFESSEPSIEVQGDSALMKRLVRNALENAYSFAQAKIQIQVQQADKGITFKIKDDGPGFSPESLKDFGQRKFSRMMPVHGEKRISIGLGSVIMRSIVDVYRGDLKAQNVESGAQIEVFLPHL